MSNIGNLIKKCVGGSGVGLPQLGWRLVVLMAVCIYIGNALKDLVCAPRPNGMGHGDVRPKVIHSNAEAASYALVGHRPLGLRAFLSHNFCHIHSAPHALCSLQWLNNENPCEFSPVASDFGLYSMFMKYH